MAANDTTKKPATRTDAGAATAPHPPKRLRLPLKTIDDLKAEMARVYREARAGALDVPTASKLANMLGIQGRLIVGHELAEDIEELKELVKQRRPR